MRCFVNGRKKGGNRSDSMDEQIKAAYGYTDRQLESWDYSREEIFDGLRDCAVCYGADPQLAEAFRP